jgi:hypothetical protein
MLLVSIAVLDSKREYFQRKLLYIYVSTKRFKKISKRSLWNLVFVFLYLRFLHSKNSFMNTS